MERIVMERNRMLDNEMPAKATPELIGSGCGNFV
jgi:hypothetical protein